MISLVSVGWAIFSVHSVAWLPAAFAVTVEVDPNSIVVSGEGNFETEVDSAHTMSTFALSPATDDGGSDDPGESRLESQQCFMVGWPWLGSNHESELAPPECISGLTAVSTEDAPYTRTFIGLGPETSGTTALLDYLSRDLRVVGVGERDFFSWEQNFRKGIGHYLDTHRRAYHRLVGRFMGNGEDDDDEGDDEYDDGEDNDQDEEDCESTAETKSGRDQGNEGSGFLSDGDDSIVHCEEGDRREGGNIFDSDKTKKTKKKKRGAPRLDEMVFAEKSPLYG
jgi:hypothetical protein